jgi:hypothetical protein
VLRSGRDVEHRRELKDLEPSRLTPIPRRSTFPLGYHTKVHRSRARMIEVVSLSHSEYDLIASLDSQCLLGGAVVHIASDNRIGCVKDRAPVLRDAGCVGGVGRWG